MRWGVEGMTMAEKQHPRLKPHWFHILAALARDDLHGSDIVRDVLAQTEGALTLWPATLYGMLDELLDEGLIVELLDDQRPAGVSGRRRYYRVTADGKAALAAEAERLASLAGVVRQRLGNT